MNIDYERCSIVINSLHDYFTSVGKLSNIEYPKEIKYASNNYFLYMFYSCLLDYGMKSKLYHSNLSNAYSKYPDIFIPGIIIKMPQEKLKEIIVNNIHPRYPNIALKKWVNLSNELCKYNNLVEVLSKITSFKDLICFISSLNSYGQKTGSLLARIITDSKICNFNEMVESIPIDRHDIEISYLTGIISVKSITSKEIKDLSNFYVKIGNDLNISPSEIDKYLWEVGNTFCNRKKCSDCPLNIYCKEGITASDYLNHAINSKQIWFLEKLKNKRLEEE